VTRASAVATTPVLWTVVRTHYEVLGVGAGASRGKIKVAYQRLAREVHPDAAGRGDEGFIRLQCCTPSTMPSSRIPTSARDTTTPSSRAPRQHGLRGSSRGGGRRTTGGVLSHRDLGGRWLTMADDGASEQGRLSLRDMVALLALHSLQSHDLALLALDSLHLGCSHSVFWCQASATLNQHRGTQAEI
jgi:hypothetical protein